MKRYLSLLMLLVLVFALGCTSAFADHYDSDGWSVEFTGSEMIQNFNSGTINEIFSSVEPGDSATVTISLRNSSSGATMWYMHNEAINTLEQIRKSAEGGLYSYKLTYTTAAGVANVLYDSTQVGGENADKRDPEGLNQISDKLKDYFYLDNFGSGQRGTVTLYMELEGETQGNGYQNTNAAVEVQFAVEPVTTGGTTRLYSDRPRTADDSALGLYMICTTGSCLLLMVGMLMNKKRRNSILLCVLMLLPLLSGVKAAADDYSYVIKVYSGNVGTIGGQSVKTYVREKGEPVDLSEIQYGGVDLNNDKYYVKGIRLAGRDNVEESLSTLYFNAQEDAEYCVAYGVRGNLTSYTVNYVDANGRELAPSQTLYGNVGDKPVVAFRYIDGYQPNAQNMKKTLEADASKNQFTFTYTPIPAATNTTVTVVTENNGNNAGGNNNAGAANGANGNAANAQGNAADTQENAGADAANEANGNAEAVPQPADEAAAAVQNGGNAANAAQPEAEAASAAQAPVPTYNPAAVATAAPAELIDLDEVGQNGGFAIGDVAVPLATLQARAENGDRGAKIAIALKYTGYVLLVLIVCALITLAILLGNRKRASKRAYAAVPIRDMSYDGNNHEVYYSPADFKVDDLFDKRS